MSRRLNVVVAPGSSAEREYEAIAPGFRPQSSEDMQFYGGRTLPRLAFVTYYLGAWSAADATAIDHALAGAMEDPRLNNVLAQYFPHATLSTTFAGSHKLPATVPARVTKT